VDESLSFARECLQPGGSALWKLLQGAELKPIMQRVKEVFGTGALVKPPASRKESKEIYLCVRQYNGTGSG
jgi:23S rRNA (uridine2552-2'-O)-methyltransferase